MEFTYFTSIFSSQVKMSSQRQSLSHNKVNGNSNIPLRRNISKQMSVPASSTRISVNDPQAHRWKQKYEESEERRKLLLGEKEKGKMFINFCFFFSLYVL